MVGTWRAASVKAKGKCRDVTLWRPQQSSDVACRVPSNVEIRFLHSSDTPFVSENRGKVLSP